VTWPARLSPILTQTRAEQFSGAESTSDESSFQGAQPAETDLVFSPGSNKLMLTSQHPIVRAIIQDAIENLRAAMLFNNAFPDICIALGLIKDCLLTAANHLRPGAKEVLERLEQDHDYMLKITPLVLFFFNFEITSLTALSSRVLEFV
jgi:hypothetical protein